MVRAGDLSLGHARALLGLPDAAQMIALAATVLSDGLTVREVERRVRDTAATTPSKRKAREATSTAVARPAALKQMEDQLRRKFQTDVAVALSGADRGEVRLSFYSTDDFERLLDLLLGASREAV